MAPTALLAAPPPRLGPKKVNWLGTKKVSSESKENILRARSRIQSALAVLVVWAKKDLICTLPGPGQPDCRNYLLTAAIAPNGPSVAPPPPSLCP